MEFFYFWQIPLSVLIEEHLDLGHGSTNIYLELSYIVKAKYAVYIQQEIWKYYYVIRQDFQKRYIYLSRCMRFPSM